MKRMNLLPKPKQQELRYERFFHGVMVAIILSTVVLMVGVIVQLGVWAYLERSQLARLQDIEQLKKIIDKTEHAQQKEKIKLVNNQIGDFLNLSQMTPQWSKVLQAFAIQVPADVKITRLSVDAKTLKVEISGYSPTRESVIALYNNINADKDNFHDIDYPLENVAKPVDVTFNFTFFISDGVLTPKKQ